MYSTRILWQTAWQNARQISYYGAVSANYLYADSSIVCDIPVGMFSVAKIALQSRKREETTLADRLAEFKGLEKCGNCNEYDCAECQTCTSCNARVESTCNDCEVCSDCCECYYCEGCDGRVDSDTVCGTCNKCEGCCDCYTCSGCRSTYSSRSDTSQCSRCEYCTDGCCECQYCSECDDTVRNTCGDCDRCSDCCDCSESKHILAYETDVTERLPFFGKPKDRTWFGIELEVNVNGDLDSAAERCANTLDGFAILKSDSSIGDDGFEIVTAPSDLASHREQWSSFWQDNPTNYLTSWKSGKCGMHVHISRPSELVIGKMLCFVNAEENKRFITEIAGREDNDYTVRSPKKVSDCRKRLPEGRYEALNLTNTDTIELRIFRGTLKESSFWKNLEFTHALVHFCRETSIRNLDVRAFTAYVTRSNNSKQYKHLISFLREKHILKSDLVLTASNVEREEIIAEC